MLMFVRVVVVVVLVVFGGSSSTRNINVTGVVVVVVVGGKNPRLHNESRDGRVAGSSLAGQHTPGILDSRTCAEAARQQAAGGQGRGGKAAGSKWGG